MAIDGMSCGTIRQLFLEAYNGTWKGLSLVQTLALTLVNPNPDLPPTPYCSQVSRAASRSMPAQQSTKSRSPIDVGLTMPIDKPKGVKHGRGEKRSSGPAAGVVVPA